MNLNLKNNMDRRTCLMKIFATGAALFTGTLLLLNSEKNLKAELKPTHKTIKSKKKLYSMNGSKNKKGKLAMPNKKKRIMA